MRTRPNRRFVNAARSLLLRRFSADEAGGILERTADHYRRALPDLPREKTFGARFMLRAAAFDVALCRALAERGVAEEEAFGLVADASWEVFKRSDTILARGIGFFARDPLRSVFWTARLSRRLLFRPPGWRMDDVPVPDGFGFDVRRCPLSDYLRPQGLGKLCQRAMCEMDMRQAEARGIRLTRTGTLAGGAERCDFRFSAGG
jgi:ubiquinone biosynthesis protein